MVCTMQGSHEQEASSRYNSGYGASTSAASSARSANIFTSSCQDVFVHAASAPDLDGRFALLVCRAQLPNCYHNLCCKQT